MKSPHVLSHWVWAGAGIRHLFECIRSIVLAAMGGVGVLFAHDPGISTAQGQLSGSGFELITGFSPADAQMLLPETLRTDGPWTEAEFEAARDTLERLAPELWEVRAGAKVLSPRAARIELASGDALNFEVEYPAPDAAPLMLRARKIGELPAGHRQFVIIADAYGSTITKKLLSVRDAAIEVPLGAPATASGAETSSPGAAMPTFWGFLALGMQHIWTGYDHLLFLLALLVVCRGFRSSVAIVSCFTIAHSLTLALATADLVHLPSRFVEPLIAASIVFVGAENLWRRGTEPPGRWVVTFAFGLIHGFGFASVLRDLGVGRSSGGIAMPLVAFNLGVELGQIGIAAIVLPLLWRMQKKAVFVRMGIPAISALVAIAGLYWFIVRTVRV